MKNGLTLAEVLITLGIIGIVAAMTIPTLITNYQKKTTATRVKKAYAELLQAIKLSENDNDSMESWTVGNDVSIENTEKYIEKYIMPYYKGLTLCSEGLDDKCGNPMSEAGANYLTMNGTTLSFLYRPTGIYVIIDVNNKSNPNRIGYDAFYFKTNEKYELLPFGWYNGLTREQIKKGYKIPEYEENTDIYSCKKSASEDTPNELNRHACTALLYLDNWEFKKDYPW